MTEEERQDRIATLRQLHDRYTQAKWSPHFRAFLERRMDQVCVELMVPPRDDPADHRSPDN